jgi:hypothetical protein
MALRTSRIPLNLAKCKDPHLYDATNTPLVPISCTRTTIPYINRYYATVPAVTSPAQTPAVQQSSEPKKGVMDYVLTTADAVPHFFLNGTDLYRL